MYSSGRSLSDRCMELAEDPGRRHRQWHCLTLPSPRDFEIQKAAATSPSSVTSHDPSSITTVMFFCTSSILAFVVVAIAQADPSINTPAAVVQCQPAQISFTATSTPVFISILPGGQPSAAPLADLGQHNASPFTWTANIAQGTSITFQVRDSKGAVAYSAPVTIQPSSDSSCLGV
ncbi:transmembrane protein, putative [Rhizoctonia solani AG-3 Rhs1AP]|uniref:Transmembrane protein, putative n=2 Tax=Rhizoctonia solani AG-3 TaxID=1086053 RepID=X8J5A9_9AGAM|nr:transmembrane protein, putative [Rhizoctonia solani AG-3 Rhs1AP]KEP51161.1 putative transmembrane protein [Rhizoctonia solani 123E]